MRNIIISIGMLSLLAGCSSQQFGMNHQMNGMQHGNGMMGGDQAEADGILPGQKTDVSSLPEAKQTSTIDVQDGQTISLNPTLVRKTIDGKEMVMYGYNGEIPGPLLKVKQGSTFTVNVKNNIDLPTTIHWHGLRLDNANDGAEGLTQDVINPGGKYSYTVKVPDEGIYWYHTHVREDLQQPMGLYGNILVAPKDSSAYSTVNREAVLAINDLLLDNNGTPVPFGASGPDHTLMGRFGNTLLVNGSDDYRLNVSKGDVIRFYLTNTANTRTFKIDFDGAKMKLVGGDNGRYEMEQFVDSVILAPSERVIVDVLFSTTGTTRITHRTPERSYELGNVEVSSGNASPSYSQEFLALAAHEDVSRDVDAFRSSFDKVPDHTLVLDMSMMGGMGGGMGGMMGAPSKDGIEWEDNGISGMQMGNMMQWKMIDQETGAANDKLVYTAKVGDKVKIRIINKQDSPHPMQHPIHFHGQRFLVLSDNGVQNTNFVWKDTTLVPAGHTVDILLDVSNPGDWMFHCHIAEHLGSGMMGLLRVQ
ncbi:MAG: multicopper oxidase family protein [Candidatus Peribacteraceae bacterium]|nr:multicopper oxidase family protein [Candidatus Peribacteraceae bacterium]